MKIVVDKMPDACKDCFYYKSNECFLLEQSNADQSYARLDNCPLIALENNI